MPSEISGLPSMRGYLKLQNLVVRLDFPYLDLPARHPAFVERPVPDARGPATAVPAATQAAAITQTALPEALIAHERPASPPVAQQPFFQ